MSANDACDNAKYKIASEYYVYNGAPIPKSAVNLVNIGGTDEDTSRSAFYWVLATRLKDYCGGTVNPDDVQVSFVAGNANGSSMITFLSSRGYQQVALNDIVSEAKGELRSSLVIRHMPHLKKKLAVKKMTPRHISIRKLHST